MLIADPKGRFLDANPAATSLTGYTRDELVTMRIPDVVAFERAWTETEFGRLRQDGAWRGDVTLRHKDGSQTEAEVRAFPIVAPSGPLYVAILRDVTERRRLDAERAQLAETAARVTERERLAMNLHDGAIQRLFGVSMQLAAVQRKLAFDGLGTVAVRAASDAVREAIDALRDEIEALRSPVRQASSLGVELRKLAETASRWRAVAVDADIDDDVDHLLGPDEAAELLAVAREAVSNATRHSEGSQITISLSRTAGAIVLVVRDDGRGFEPRSVDGNGHGLRNMSARARALGTEATISSGDGSGTEVRLSMSIPRG